MPRPYPPSGLTVALLAAGCCAALGPLVLGTALAAAAGTLFEAVPFVLAAEALPGGRPRALATALGCGCGTRIPGALSPIALALCWVTFGPAVTVARALAGLAILAHRERGRFAKPRRGGFARPHPRAVEAAFDPFLELLALAPWAAAAAVLAGSLARVPPAAMHSPVGLVAAVVAGIALGYAAPCGTAAIAIAAAFSARAPGIAAGVLLVGGLVPRDLAGRFVRIKSAVSRVACAPARTTLRRCVLERLALCVSAAALAATGPHGLVSPRLVPLLWPATLLAALGVRRRTRARSAALVPAIMLAAMLAGSPPPPDAATETELGDAFPGERLSFTGIAERRGATTVLERFAITCCRADAAPVAVRLARPIDVANGSWVAAHGMLEAGPAGLALQTASWHTIRAPADVFMYR